MFSNKLFKFVILIILLTFFAIFSGCGGGGIVVPTAPDNGDSVEPISEESYSEEVIFNSKEGVTFKSNYTGFKIEISPVEEEGETLLKFETIIPAQPLEEGAMELYAIHKINFESVKGINYSPEAKLTFPAVPDKDIKDAIILYDKGDGWMLAEGDVEFNDEGISIEVKEFSSFASAYIKPLEGTTIGYESGNLQFTEEGNVITPLTVSSYSSGWLWGLGSAPWFSIEVLEFSNFISAEAPGDYFFGLWKENYTYLSPGEEKKLELTFYGVGGKSQIIMVNNEFDVLIPLWIDLLYTSLTGNELPWPISEELIKQNKNIEKMVFLARTLKESISSLQKEESIHNSIINIFKWLKDESIKWAKSQGEKIIEGKIPSLWLTFAKAAYSPVSSVVYSIKGEGFQQLEISVNTSPELNINPKEITVKTGETVQFQSQITSKFTDKPLSCPGIIWSVVEGKGTITQEGLYTAGTESIDTIRAEVLGMDAIGESTVIVSESPTCNAPGSFTLSATPECNGTISQIRLNWTNSSGASSYDVYRNNTLYYSDLTGTQFINSGNITAETTYSYYIVAKNSCDSTTSNIVSATAISCGSTNSLGQVQLSSPSNGITLPPGNITFSWNSVSNATKYQFILYNQLGQVALDTTKSSTSLIVALNTEEAITWKVRAGNDSGNWGAWSNTRSLTLKSTTTIKPDLIVNNIWTEPNPPIAAGFTTIGIEIKNQGNADTTKTFFLEFYFDGTYQGHVYINGLTAGSTNTSYWQAVTWPSDTNLHTIKGVVDPDNAIIESNESNNQYSIQVKAIEPPVGIGTLKIESVPGIANVYIDGVYKGETPSSGYLTISNLTAGNHDLKVTKSGYKDWIEIVTIPSGSIKYKAVILESITTKPDPPTPLSPGYDSAPGELINTLTPTLHWQTVPNADYYNLAISVYPYGTSNIIYNPQQISGNSITLPSGVLEAEKKYRWNMRAHNSADFSDYSKTLYFQTESISASINSYSPSNKITINTGQSFIISTSFTNTGNTSAYFYPGVSIWNSNGNLVFTDWGGKTYLNKGQQGNTSWSPTINTPGEYWIQFGVWNEAKSELLDKKPSPSQNLIKVVSLSSQKERLTNGSFSSGASGWTLVGDFWAGTNFANYHTSPGYAAGGVDSAGLPKDKTAGWMYQTVTIPSGATSATLSFWYNITSEESGSTAYDVLNVTIKSSAGNYLATVAVFSNLNKSTLGSYKKITFDMIPYKGQTVRIHFLTTTDDYLHTVFRIDDVSLMSDG